MRRFGVVTLASRKIFYWRRLGLTVQLGSTWSVGLYWVRRAELPVRLSLVDGGRR